MLDFHYSDKSFRLKLFSESGNSFSIKTSSIKLVQKRKDGTPTKKITIASFEYHDVKFLFADKNFYESYYFLDKNEKVFIKNDYNKLLTIYNNPICVSCGVIATYASLDKYPDSASVHFNVYSMDTRGNIKMMTKDHIIPRSLYGPNIMNNIQTFCESCNSIKGAQLQNFRLETLDKQVANLTAPKIVSILSV